MTDLNSTSPHGPRWLAYLSLAMSMSLVGCYVALSKPLVAVFPVFLLAWLRFGIGGIAMLRWHVNLLIVLAGAMVAGVMLKLL